MTYADSSQVDEYSIALLPLRRFADVDSEIARVSKRVGPLHNSVVGRIIALALAREDWDSLRATVGGFGRRVPGAASYVDESMRWLHGQLGDLAWMDSNSRPLARVYADALFRDQPARPGTLVSIVARFRMDTLPSELRIGYLFVARTYAMAGLPAGARRLVARYDAEVTDTLQKRRQRDTYGDALGWIALAENQPREAIVQFRRALDMGLNYCPQCLHASLGLAHEKTGARDSAIASFERAVNEVQSFNNPLDATQFYALSYRRLGDLYEQQGDTGKAVTYYTKFVTLWDKADPDLQPKVTAVRARLKRLAHTERP